MQNYKINLVLDLSLTAQMNVISSVDDVKRLCGFGEQYDIIAEKTNSRGYCVETSIANLGTGRLCG